MKTNIHSRQPSEQPSEKFYIAIDLKSFYASVECVERGLDPLTTNLVVADRSRTEKTICLAVSPSLKAWGIGGRARLFEVEQRVREINRERKSRIKGAFAGSCVDSVRLAQEPQLQLDFIAAPPRMAAYMEVSSTIYKIYLNYIAPEDIHVYSIDEVFLDVTDYLQTYQTTPVQLASRMIQEVFEKTGITATAGVGTNLYLCKVAMDIVAKHTEPDEKGVRVAQLDEMSYRRLLWNHRPLSDFWRVGRGYVRKLEENGLYTMGDIARCSLGGDRDYYNEELLYRLFGVNAELLIDHAWGWEPCTMAQIKAYKPESNSIGSGQVLHCAYDYEGARLIVREMTDLLVLDLVDKGLATDQMVLTVGYDIENLSNPQIRRQYKGPVTTDGYGRTIPKHAHGTVNLDRRTSSTRQIMDAVMKLFDRIVDPLLLVRRINITANHVVKEEAAGQECYEQLSLFDAPLDGAEQESRQEVRNKERRMQQAVLDIQKKYGKNAILKGMNLEEGATTMERNRQIGGHKA